VGKTAEVEALLAAAASPVPPPAPTLVADATLADPAELWPEDLPRLLHLLAHADLYLQDEVEVALHPTLTRVWSHAGRSGQRRVQAPARTSSRTASGWSTGATAPGLRAGRRPPRRAAGRPAAPGRRALPRPWPDRHGAPGQPGHPHPKGSRLLRALLAELGTQLVLVYTPTDDPDANRIQWLWPSLRRSVTHTHQRQRLEDLVADAERWARTIPVAKVLSQIASPFAPDQHPVERQEFNHAA
jgi:hypothetical protein